MGKATRWFRGLLGLTRRDPNPNPNPNPKPPKDKRRWSFVKSYRDKSSFSSSSSSRRRPHSYDNNASAAAASSSGGIPDDDASKHAIAVAAATAAVAEAAVAAAQAAAAVVRLTHGGPRGGGGCRGGGGERRVWAVVVIQSHFRGYLARRALRALKGLVKLQALVRGHIMRRKTTETMRCMQAMLRAQARARSVRAYIPESPHSGSKSCQLHQPGPPTPEKIEQFVRATSAKHDQSPKIKRNGSRSSSRTNTASQDRGNFGSSWSDPRMDDPTFEPRVTSSTRTCKTDEDRSDRILEIDTGRPPILRRRNLFEYPHSGPQPSDHITHSYTTSKDSTAHYTVPSPSASCEVVQSLNPLKFLEEIEDALYCTAENSPQMNSATSVGGSSRRGPFTPTKSDGSKSFLSGYSDCPSYMAYTESSRAKLRSLSAPKQRPQYDRQMGSTKRYSVHGLGEHNPRSSGRMSSMQANFTSKAYPGSGRLDRLGMPVRDSTVVYYSGYLN